MSSHLAKPRSALVPGGVSVLAPYVRDPERAQALTARWLLPALADLVALFLHIRLAIDSELQRRQPMKLGKPYPVGQCLEITQAVELRLRRLHVGLLDAGEKRGYEALTHFFREGGQMRRVWGDLRGQFFQNAFVVGALYVDVSNDTVTPTKPKVEILPFDASGMTPVADYFHFARLARQYWNAQVYANLVMPAVAPFCPVVTVNPFGVVKLQAAMHSMVSMTRAGGFSPSAAFLADETLPLPLSEFVSQALSRFGFAVAANRESGRQEALDNCAHYRRRRWDKAPDALARVIKTVVAANKVLERLRYVPFGDLNEAASRLPLAFEQQGDRLRVVALQPVTSSGDSTSASACVRRDVPHEAEGTEKFWKAKTVGQLGLLEPWPLVGNAMFKASRQGLAALTPTALAQVRDAGLLRALYLQGVSMQHIRK